MECMKYTRISKEEHSGVVLCLGATVRDTASYSSSSGTWRSVPQTPLEGVLMCHVTHQWENPLPYMQGLFPSVKINLSSTNVSRNKTLICLYLMMKPVSCTKCTTFVVKTPQKTNPKSNHLYHNGGLNKQTNKHPSQV